MVFMIITLAMTPIMTMMITKSMARILKRQFETKLPTIQVLA